MFVDGLVGCSVYRTEAVYNEYIRSERNLTEVYKDKLREQLAL